MANKGNKAILIDVSDNDSKEASFGGEGALEAVRAWVPENSAK